MGVDHSRNIKIKYLSSDSPAMGLSVCHLAMGLLGLANISDQCFNSALVELQPTSTQPATRLQSVGKHCKTRVVNIFASQIIGFRSQTPDAYLLATLVDLQQTYRLISTNSIIVNDSH